MRSIIALSAIMGSMVLACVELGDAQDVAVERGAFDDVPSDGKLHAKGGRYLVAFRDHAAGKKALDAAGAHIVLELRKHHAAAVQIPADALAALADDPAFESIEPDPVRKPLSLGGPAQSVPYGVTMVQADRVTPGTAHDVRVCVIDSGLWTGHADASPEVSGLNTSGTGLWKEDKCGHGSHVAGTIAAPDNDQGVIGVFPSARLHIVKVFGDDCDWAYASELVEALDLCLQDAGGDSLVVSMSLGGEDGSTVEDKAFESANRAGVLSIAAAGNDGNRRRSFPASYDSVVSVAAVDSDKKHADFSQRNSAVELAAPGVAVLSTVPWSVDALIAVDEARSDGASISLAPETEESGVSGTLVGGGLCDSVGSWEGAIVVCERGDITFAKKVTNAARGGAVGVVIYNNEAGGFLGTCGNPNWCSLPAIGISREDGEELVANHLGEPGTLLSRISDPGSGYEAWEGTSMATPHVAAVAALVWSHDKRWTNEDIRHALTATAEDLGSAGRDNRYGFGLVQAEAALDLLTARDARCVPNESPERSCRDGVDNDCDGATDANDLNCGGPMCLPAGATCGRNTDCCSEACRGPVGRMTCK